MFIGSHNLFANYLRMVNMAGYKACPRENTSCHLITEGKSCRVGLISRLATILASLCCVLWEVRLALYSTFTPPTSVIVCGPNFSWSQADLKVFLRLLRFSSLSKIDSQSKSSGLSGCRALGSCMTVWRQPEAIQPSGLEVKVISRTLLLLLYLNIFCIVHEIHTQHLLEALIFLYSSNA